MAAKIAPLNIRIIGNAHGLLAALGKGQRGVNGFAITVEQQASNIVASFKRFSTFVLPAGLIAGLGFGLKMAAELQQVEASFKSLTGSVEAADAVIKDLRQFAADTPLEFRGLAKASQTLLAYGTANTEVVGQLRLLADVSLGSQEKLDRLAVAFGQVQAKGKLMAQEVNQMVENGFNPLVEISRTSGRSMNELFKTMERGEITFADVTGAFRSATSEGGRFFGAMENQSKTLIGQWTRLRDNIGLLATDIGKLLIPAASKFVQELTEMVQYLRDFDASTAESIAKTAAFTVALTGTALVLPRLITLGKSLTLVIRSIGTASTIAQALSGPAGWASIATGLAVAGGAVYAVDQLFDSLNETQKKTVALGGEVASSQAEQAKQISKTGAALKDAAKSQEIWLRIAARWRETLETPVEAYRRQIEDLSLAVQEGGLEWEFFERGVAKAIKQLDGIQKKAAQLKRPDALLAGTQAADDAIYAFQNQSAPSNSVDDRVAKETDSLRKSITTAGAKAAAMKMQLAEASEIAAKANVDRLSASFAKARKESRALLQVAQELGDIRYDNNTFMDRLGALGSKIAAAPFGSDGTHFDESKIKRRNAAQNKADSALEIAMKQQQELTRAQAEAEATRQAAADARAENLIAQNNLVLAGLASAIGNKPTPQPMSL